jgi:signal peptidase I
VEDSGLYRGEVVRRSALVATLLTVLMPGLGHVYAGLARRGLLVWSAFAVVASSLALFAAARDIFAFKPAFALLALYGYCAVAMAIDVRRLLRRTDSTALLQPYNHPIVYLGLFVGLYVLPAWGLGVYVSSYLVGSFEVADGGMYPRLHEGDRVYYRRGGFGAEGPRRGDLCVVHPSGVEGLRVLRVVGEPGDEVGIEPDGTVVLNAARVERSPLGAVALAAGASDGENGASLLGFSESMGAARYDVFFDERSLLSPVGANSTPPESWYFLADNRTADGLLDSRVHGPLPRQSIVGRPLFVWYSESGGEPVWSRVGLPVR